MDKQIIPANDIFIGRNIPALKDDHIHIWSIDINESEHLLSFCKSALTEAQINQSNFFEFDESRKSYIVSQGCLRLLLSYYLKRDAGQVNIGRHRKGKPFSEDDDTLFFNISHSGEKCVLAFGRNQEVGIDLEQLRQLSDLDELIEKNFNQKEQKYINADASARSLRFFQFWTMKESYLKAIGEGMRLTPDQIEFRIEREKIKLHMTNGINDSEHWLFEKFEIDQDYIGTLSYLYEKTRISYYHISTPIS